MMTNETNPNACLSTIIILIFFQTSYNKQDILVNVEKFHPRLFLDKREFVKMKSMKMEKEDCLHMIESYHI